MSKIRFDLKKLPVPVSIRLASRVLQAVDTQIHESAAKFMRVELFARGSEQGFSLHLDDREEEISKRVAFAQEYKSKGIVVYYAPAGNMGEFMRQLTAFKNNERSLIKIEIFNPDEIDRAARFICDFFDER